MTCPTCASANPAGARFCNHCGTPLVAVPTPAGERRLVSVLFVDVVDSTRLASQVGAEAWAEVMNGAFAFMNRSVASYGGTVGRLMGDAILAFFGAPKSHEDDAERAVLTALDIRGGALAYRESLARDYPDVFGRPGTFEIRAGISTGISVLTTVGDEIKAEYTAMGDTANTASRLQSLAKPGSVVIGPVTHSLVSRAFELAPLGLKEIRGHDEPIAVYEVLMALSDRRDRRGVEGMSSPVVGRDDELAALDLRLDALREGRGGVVALIAEAGLGKSRLMAELRQRAQRSIPGVRWIEGRALSYAQGVPYFAWRRVILRAVGASDMDPPATVRAKLHDELGAYDDVASSIAIMLAVEEEGPQEATNVSARIAAAVEKLLAHLGKDGPVVLALEDLHWADPASVDLLRAVARSSLEHPLLVVAALRPERQAASWALPGALDELLGEDYLELRLEPLDTAASKTLLDNLLVIKDLPPAVADGIIGRSDGNPFYLEEVLKSLIDSGHVFREGGGWRARADIAQVALPDSINGVLSARIDSLPESARQVAQTAAVIGRYFQRGVLSSVLEGDAGDSQAAELPRHLETLTMEDLLREQATQDEPEYAFKHALTQEAAYERLLTRRRRELHRRVGYALLALHGERADELAAVLAHHFTRAEEWEQSARFSLVAARQAFRLFALPEALRLFTAAVDGIERLPIDDPLASEGERRRLLELRVDALLGWVEAARNARMHEQVDSRARLLDTANHAVELARRLGDKRRLAVALVTHGGVLVLSGFPGSGFEPLLEAHDLSLELGDDKLFLLPFWVATELMVSDDPTGAAEQLARVVELAAKVGDKGVQAHALGSRAAALARIGEFERSLELIPAALAAAYESGSIIKRADAYMLVGGALMDMGQREMGLEYISYGTDIALAVEGRECASAGLWMRGQGKMADASGLDGALVDLDHSIRIGTGTATEQILYGVRASRASCRFRRGAVSAAAELETELKHAQTMNDGFASADVSLQLGEAMTELGELDRASELISFALDWYRQRFMKPYAIRALFALIAVREAQGDAAAVYSLRAEFDTTTASLPKDLDFSQVPPVGSGGIVDAGTP